MRHRNAFEEVGLAERLEPAAGDLAFAPTVVVDDLDAPPPSGPVVLSQPGHALQVVPLAQEPGSPWPTRLRTSLRDCREEMADLWSTSLAIVVEDHGAPRSDGLSRITLLGRRLTALWGLWRWDEADLVRAAAIGLAVFLAVAALGASWVTPGAHVEPPGTHPATQEVRSR